MTNRIISTLQYILFKKILSFHLNEPDKQQIINIIGTDLTGLTDAIEWLLFGGFTSISLLLCIIVGSLYIVGYSAILGLIIFFLFGFPLQLYFGTKLSMFSALRKSVSDKRVQVTTELIRGIRFLKCSASEIALMDNVHEYRNKEIEYIKKKHLYLSYLFLGNFLIPSFMMLTILCSYFFLFGHEFSSTITLYLVTIISVTSLSVRTLPIVAGLTAQLIVSLNRIDDIMGKMEIQKHTEIKTESKNNDDVDVDIIMDNASFNWFTQEQFVLKNISMRIKRGQLVAVVGSVASGKTSLIQAILGELKCSLGKMQVKQDTICYLSQTAYIRNESLRNNIILDLEFNKEIYEESIIASALIDDLIKLPNYDLTKIGDEGVNISGGQKMRVAFARIIYKSKFSKQCNIFLLDDPLSSVDVYIGKYIFFNGIIKYFKNENKTCLIVMNSHLHLLHNFDEIVIMNNGTIDIHTSIK
eukprot:348343_1